MCVDNKIDFVIPWVNGDDPEWIAQFDLYSEGQEGGKLKRRYRNWENLQYLFRAFEKCTPWVRKVHFVTCGHIPDWLNTEHEKLNIVKHSDFLNIDSLPVFSSHPIEINLHRIIGLAEKFIYFNDDTFLLKPVPDTYFFKNDMPRDICVFNAIFLDSISHVRLNDIEAVHKSFSKYDVIKKNFFKIFNFRYGLHQLRTLFLLPWPQMTGFYDPHQPQPFLKKTYEDVWSSNNDVLTKTSVARFRTKDDVNQYLFRYWHLLKGNFYPRSFSGTNTIPVRDLKDVSAAAEAIGSNKLAMLCINDELEYVEKNIFDIYIETINRAFDTVFPEKSSFEL